MKHDGLGFRAMHSSRVMPEYCTGVVCWNIGIDIDGKLNVNVLLLLEGAEAGAGAGTEAVASRELKSNPPLLEVPEEIGAGLADDALLVEFPLADRIEFGEITTIKSPFWMPTEARD